MNKPLKLVISNQKGGVAKTTTTITLARFLAGEGYRVLVVDTDPQGSVTTLLGLKATAHLHHFLIKSYRFEECLTPTSDPNIQVMCGSRDTTEAEHVILSHMFREFTFEKAFSEHDRAFDAVLFDVAPSISLFQTCAMIYCQNVLIPAAMDTLSLQGCSAAVNACEVLTTQFTHGNVNVRAVGILPVMVNSRLQMTEVIMSALKQIADRYSIPLLPSIRQDIELVKAAKVRKFLADHAPASRALGDYDTAFRELVKSLGQSRKDEDHQLQTAQA